MDQTNPSDQMDMEIDLSPAEWLEKIIQIEEEERAIPRYRLKNQFERYDLSCYGNKVRNNYVPFSGCHHELYCPVTYDCDDKDDDEYYDSKDGDDDFGAFRNFNIYMKYDKNRKKLDSNDMRLIRLAPLLVSQPQLEKICKKRNNEFLSSCFKTYLLHRDWNRSGMRPDDEYHEIFNEINYLINFWGSKLTTLLISDYPFSRIMPLIKNTCPNIKDLDLTFREINSADFENVFSSMSHLNSLSIRWYCKDSVIPDTLINSLEQVSKTLELLDLIGLYDSNKSYLPDSVTLVFPRLIALKSLYISVFQLNQQTIQSISEMKNLNCLDVSWIEKFQLNCGISLGDGNINMYPIGNMKNLKELNIDFACGVTDEFINNLCNNAKKLTHLCICDTNITDKGMKALENFRVEDSKTKIELTLLQAE